MGHVKDRWTSPGNNGRRVHNDRWGKGRRWQARWTDRAGDEHAQTFSTKDAADAHLRSVDLGTAPADARGLTFRVYAEQWQASQLHWRPATVQAVNGVMAKMLLPELGDLELVEMTRAHVQAAVVRWSEHYAPSRVKTAYGYVASIYKHALDDRLVAFTPCIRVSLPEDHKVRVRPMLTGQVLQLRDTIAPHYRHAVEFVAATGLRGGEWRGLTLDRIDLDSGELRIDRQLIDRTVDCAPVFGPPKTPASERTLELPVPAADALRAQLRDYPVSNPWGLLFVGRTGRAITRKDASDVWRFGVNGLGLKPRSGWHDLRHYCASLLIAAGLSPTAVADWLGHDDPSITLQTYSHLWPTDHARIVAVLDAQLGIFRSPAIDGPETDQAA